MSAARSSARSSMSAARSSLSAARRTGSGERRRAEPRHTSRSPPLAATRSPTALLADAELGEDLGEDVLSRDRAGQQAERRRGAVEVDEDDLLIHAGVERAERGAQRLLTSGYRLALPFVDDHGTPLRCGEAVADEGVEPRQQDVEPGIRGDANGKLGGRGGREVALGI